MSNVIEIEHLSKSYGDVKAVSDLSLSVKRGEFFSFLGVNGAGKSTTISIMCGISKKDSGTVRIDSYNVDDGMKEIKSKLGVVFQASLLDPVLTVKENLSVRAALYGISDKDFKQRLEALSALLELEELYGRRVGKLSGGQRRRVDVAGALIHEPKILILDEPTTGLDPQSRQMLWGAILKMRTERDMTVFLTTHYMEEVTDSDRIIILDSGRIAAEGTPHELKNRYANDTLILYGNHSEADIAALGVQYKKTNDGYRLALTDTSVATRLIVSHPELFCDYEIVKGKMDDVFIAATGKKLTEAK